MKMALKSEILKYISRLFIYKNRPDSINFHSKMLLNARLHNLVPEVNQSYKLPLNLALIVS